MISILRSIKMRLGGRRRLRLDVDLDSEHYGTPISWARVQERLNRAADDMHDLYAANRVQAQLLVRDYGPSHDARLTVDLPDRPASWVNVLKNERLWLGAGAAMALMIGAFLAQMAARNWVEGLVDARAAERLDQLQEYQSAQTSALRREVSGLTAQATLLLTEVSELMSLAQETGEACCRLQMSARQLQPALLPAPGRAQT